MRLPKIQGGLELGGRKRRKPRRRPIPFLAAMGTRRGSSAGDVPAASSEIPFLAEVVYTSAPKGDSIRGLGLPILVVKRDKCDLKTACLEPSVEEMSGDGCH